MNIEKTIIGGAQSLKNSNIKNPYLDSELLLSKVIKKDRKYMILNSKKKLNFRYLENFNNLVCRRKRGEPVAYLTNSKEFWKQKYFVNKHVLIPRPDSEILVEETLKLYEKKKKNKGPRYRNRLWVFIIVNFKRKKKFFWQRS